MNSIPQKHCPHCKQYFPATTEFFHADKHTSDHLKVYCKACRSAMSKEAHRKKHPREILPDGYKRCSDCREIKPATLEHFYPASRYAYGIASQCKKCAIAYRHQWKAKRHPPKEEIPPGFRCCTICKELLPATTTYFNKKLAGLNARCKMCDRNSQAQYRLLHRPPKPIPTEKACTKCGIVKPATKTYFPPQKRNRDGVSSWCRDCNKLYSLAHLEASLARSRHYKKHHPEITRAQYHTYRARKQAAPGKHTAQDILNQLKRQKGKCYYCHKEVGKRYHVDHVVPLSRGGSNDPSNLVIACPSCNDKKQSKLPHEWPQGGRLL